MAGVILRDFGNTFQNHFEKLEKKEFIMNQN